MWSSIFHSIFHGSLRERDALILAAAGGVALFTGMFGAWVGAYFGSRRAVKKSFRERIEIPSIVTEVRYDELARSIDAIALEVERISEAQRFAAKLLVERSNAALSAAPIGGPTVATPAIPLREPGITTPH
jgi:hypothetical protein